MRIILFILAMINLFVFSTSCALHEEAVPQPKVQQSTNPKNTQDITVKSPESGSGVYNNTSTPGTVNSAKMISPLTQ